MSIVFVILALVTAASGVAAVTLRNLVHCSLCLAITLAGLAAFYLQLDAQFVGFTQILVYVGAVAILIVFAILLTRGSEPPDQSVFSSGSLLGCGVAVVTFAVIAAAVLSSKALPKEPPAGVSAGVRNIGDQLMTKYVLPLEVLGLLLTAALIGAVVLAMRETPAKMTGGGR